MRNRIAIFSFVTLMLIGCGSSGGGGNQQKLTIPDINAYPLSTLTEDMKYALSYMWHEEKLAKDIYLSLNEINYNKQMYNIATKSETVHENLVEDLAVRYDLNLTNVADYKEYYAKEDLANLAQGEFAITKIQDLYNALYDFGKVSPQQTLQVGCMVEVTDINDLNEFIAKSSEASDLLAVFDFLKEGSYKHYWSFDNGLKSIGVADGCCSLGVINGVNYCHNEYPQ